MLDRTVVIRMRLNALREVYGGTTPKAVAHPAMGEAADHFIANAPADVEWLLAELEARDERIAILRADLEDIMDCS